MKVRLRIDPIVFETTGDDKAEALRFMSNMLAKNCSIDNRSCPLGDITCPLNEKCHSVTPDDWLKLMEVVL